jgi:tRNA modification GTPase
MLDRLDETIIAVSSAPGHGVVGIVRMSGPEAISIADSMARLEQGEPLARLPGSTRMSGEVAIDDEAHLPAVFYIFRAPRSYTRQDIVEIHTVGSPAALDLVRQRGIKLGAVAAEPGEFTARAFLNGAMDLARAEAVAGVIRAQTDTQIRVSRRMMDGSLAAYLKDVRDELSQLVALVEADIDFAEEPIEFITPGVLADRLDLISGRLRESVKGAVSVERFDVLPHILLFGPPNAGKSSLMNCLSGTSRAICAAAAGTTRDILSAPIRLRRGEAILLDAAGVDEPNVWNRGFGRSGVSGEADSGMRDRPSSRSEDEILAEAHGRVMSASEQVDLVCLVVDLTARVNDSLLQTIRSLDTASVVVAANKCDLLSPDEIRRCVDQLESHKIGPVCPVSALKGTGIDGLRSAFADALGAAVTTTLGESMLISERQRTAVASANESIERAISLSQTARETIDCADLLAFELREALDALGAVTGDVTTEDLLAQVFANFCIGK